MELLILLWHVYLFQFVIWLIAGMFIFVLGFVDDTVEDDLRQAYRVYNYKGMYEDIKSWGLRSFWNWIFFIPFLIILIPINIFMKINTYPFKFIWYILSSKIIVSIFKEAK